jgi:hypothetical protein
VIVVLAVAALAAPGAAAADGGLNLTAPAEGTTVLSDTTVDFSWVNPFYHPFGEDQTFVVATDPAFTDVVFQHGDYCESMQLCPQGVTAVPFAPGTYYWKVRLYAWDWNPESEVRSFVSMAPPAPPPPPPPPPVPPPSTPPKSCRVPFVVHRRFGPAKSAIRRAGCVVGKIRRAHSRLGKDQVISQSPVARATLTGDLRVRLTVSMGRRKH